jgi:hypothetical protein
MLERLLDHPYLPAALATAAIAIAFIIIGFIIGYW